MNAPIRRVAVAVLVLFAALFVNLNYVQVGEADKLRSNPDNRRVLLQTYERQRGYIVVDGKAIAASKATNDQLKYLRYYPKGNEYAPVTGYYSVIYGSSAIEHDEDSILSGQDGRLFVRRISDLVTGRQPRGGNVALTISPVVQDTAWKQLGSHTGAVVALDPRTGAILGLVSKPSYDPNPLSSHDTAQIKAAWKKFTTDPAQPMLDRAISGTYPPGSTFKVIVSTAALENGFTPQTDVPAPVTYTPPGTTRAIPNYAGETCAAAGHEPLIDALTVSCNTAYAHLGVVLGADKIRAAASAFGVGDSSLQIPMPVAASKLGDMPDPPAVAQSSIGQRDVQLTPLQDAMVAAAVANNGTLMKPYLVSEIQAPDFSTLDKTQPKVYKHSMPSNVAGELQQMMESVVARGTGTNAQIPGYVVGGKTGTAQNGGPDHGWFIGFAGKKGETPPIAIAVFLQNAGLDGSARATQIAGNVMSAYLNSLQTK